MPLTVDYQNPQGLTGSDGVPVEPFSALPITNRSNPDAPDVVRGLTSYSGMEIYIEYDDDIDAGRVDPRDFMVYQDGKQYTVLEVRATGRHATLVLAEPIKPLENQPDAPIVLSVATSLDGETVHIEYDELVDHGDVSIFDYDLEQDGVSYDIDDINVEGNFVILSVVGHLNPPSEGDS